MPEEILNKTSYQENLPQNPIPITQKKKNLVPWLGIAFIILVGVVYFFFFQKDNLTTSNKKSNISNKAKDTCHEPLPKIVCEDADIFIVAEAEVKEVLKIGSLNIRINSVKEYVKNENIKGLKDIKVGDEVFLTNWRSLPGTKSENYPEPVVFDFKSVVNKKIEVIMTCNTACVGDITKVF